MRHGRCDSEGVETVSPFPIRPSIEPGGTPMTRPRHVLVLWSALAVAVLAGCDGDLTSPESGSDGTSGTSFSRDITTSEMEDAVASGPRRVEIDITSDGLVAREVELERRDEMTDDEKIESRVRAVEAGDGAGTLTLELGELRIGFDAATDLETRDGRDLTVAEFVDRVESALAEGRRPSVEVKRRPPAEPQAPDDATFTPREIQLQSPDDDLEIEINVDADNLEENGSPPPRAWITVLGLRVEIREGVTELRERREPDGEGDVDFENRVASADVAAGEVTLVDGTVVRVVESTEIDGDAGDADELVSVEEVADAVDAGRFVVADGDGVLEAGDPRTVMAVEVEFEVEDDDFVDDDPGGPDDPAAFEFEDSVADADPAADTFVLAGGTEVRLDDDTRVDPEGDLHDLASVESAVEDGRPVRAEGDAVEEAEGVWLALDVKFEVDD